MYVKKNNIHSSHLLAIKHILNMNIDFSSFSHISFENKRKLGLLGDNISFVVGGKGK